MRGIKCITINLSLVVGSLLVAAVVVEVALRLIDPEFDTERDFGTVVADPNLGWRYLPNQEFTACELDFRSECVSARVNNQALREDADTAFEKPVPVQRILVVGDSQTAGEYVENDETYANLLEELLNLASDSEQYEVLNAGVPAYSIVQDWLWYRQFGELYAPDLTIVGIYVGNDIYEMIQSGPAPRPSLVFTSDDSIALIDYPLPAGDVKRGTSSTEALKQALRPLHSYRLVRQALKHSSFAGTLREIGLMRPDPAWMPMIGPNDARPRAAFECHGCLTTSLSQSYYFILAPEEEQVAFLLAEEALRELKSAVIESGSRLVVAIIPTALQVEATSSDYLDAAVDLLGMTVEEAIAFDERTYSRVLGLIQGLDIEWVSVLSEFSQYHAEHPNRTLYYDQDWHLSPLGHEVLAMQLYRCLGEQIDDSTGTRVGLAGCPSMTGLSGVDGVLDIDASQADEGVSCRVRNDTSV